MFSARVHNMEFSFHIRSMHDKLLLILAGNVKHHEFTVGRSHVIFIGLLSFMIANPGIDYVHESDVGLNSMTSSKWNSNY